MKSRRSWWLIYGFCAAIVAATLLWITVVMLRLESAERLARAEMEHQESLRLALWRMDSWLAPRLAREAARPYFEYLPYYPQERAYTQLLTAIEPGEVLTPSPLLTLESRIFLLHFQISADGELTSPQVPTGNLRDLAESTLLDASALDANADRLRQLEPLLALADLDAGLDEAETLLADLAEPFAAPPVVLEPPETPQQSAAKGQRLKTDAERQARARSYQQTQQQVIQEEMSNVANLPLQLPERDDVDVGSFVPLWLNGEKATEHAPLLLVRRVRTSEIECIQGILVSWPDLRGALLSEVADLFPEASLVPVPVLDPAADIAGRVLATIPVALEPGRAPVVLAQGLTPARLTLALTWLAAIVAALAVGVTLRASITFGQRRSRFASAVTHELRTPLTTFRMYSEMLAEGMVRDDAQRQAYLDTLKDESGRLATLVENVLAYARLEEGRTTLQRTRLTARDLLERTTPQLVRRADEAKTTLDVDLPEELAGAAMETDPDVIGQILLNLVDNACKYAGDAEPQQINLVARRCGDRLALSVCDHGPGVDPGFAHDLFIAFRRAEQRPGDATPGVGLGLALARGLARDLAGDLTLDPAPPITTPGACFTLTLPLI